MFLSVFFSLAIAGTPSVSCKVVHSSQQNQLSAEQDQLLREFVTPMMRVSTELAATSPTHQLPFSQVKMENRRMIFPQRLGEKQIVVQWSKAAETPPPLLGTLKEAPPVWLEVGSNFVFVHLQPGALENIDLSVLAQGFYGSSFFKLIEPLDPRISNMKYRELVPGTVHVWSTPENLSVGIWRGFHIWRGGTNKYQREVMDLMLYARVHGKLPRDPQLGAFLWKNNESSYLIEALKREDEKTQAAFLALQPNAETVAPKSIGKSPTEPRPKQTPRVMRKSYGESASELVSEEAKAAEVPKLAAKDVSQGQLKAEELISFIQEQGHKPRSTSTGPEFKLYRTALVFMKDPEFIKTMEAEQKVYAIFKRSTPEKPRTVVDEDADSLILFIEDSGRLPNSRSQNERDLHKALKRHEKNPDFLKLLKRHPNVWKVIVTEAAKELTTFISDSNRVPDWRQKAERDLYELMRRFEKDPEFIEQMQSRARVWRLFEGRDGAGSR